MSGEHHPGGGDVLDALFQGHAAVLMGPEGAKDHQFAPLRTHAHVLEAEFGLSARSRHVIEIPQGHQLTITEVMAAAVDVPVVVLAGMVALNAVAHVLEGATKEGIDLAYRLHGGRQGTEQGLVHIFPVRLVAHRQVRGLLDAAVLGARLADTPRTLVTGAVLETADYRTAEGPVEGPGDLVDEAVGLHLLKARGLACG